MSANVVVNESGKELKRFKSVETIEKPSRGQNGERIGEAHL